jgi:hypothetical protein
MGGGSGIIDQPKAREARITIYCIQEEAKMSSQDWVKHVREAWADCLPSDSRVIMSFALALKAEDEGDHEKAEERLVAAIVIEEATA